MDDREVWRERVSNVRADCVTWWWSVKKKGEHCFLHEPVFHTVEVNLYTDFLLFLFGFGVFDLNILAHWSKIEVIFIFLDNFLKIYLLANRINFVYLIYYYLLLYIFYFGIKEYYWKLYVKISRCSYLIYEQS